MKASISQDQYGIQLCTDYEERDNCIDVDEKDDIVEIRRACDEWLNGEGREE